MNSTLTERQTVVLQAICDAIVPAVASEQSEPTALDSNRAIDRGAVKRIEQHLARLPDEDRAEVRRCLDRLGRYGGGWWLSGFARPFHELDLASRAIAVRRLISCRDHRIGWLFRSIQRLTLHAAYVPTVSNPQSLRAADEVNRALDYRDGNDQVPKPEHLFPATLAPGQRKLACDYLVVGSGAAGAVMAAELAETGRSVLLVDGGQLIPRHQLGVSEARAQHDLYQTYGAFSLGDSEAVVTTARTFGGGPVANWGTCLDPPRMVLEQWHREFGIADCLSDDFQHSLYTVRRRMKVSDACSAVNRQNELLRVGLKRTGNTADVLHRNAVDCSDCDRCEFGCASGARQDTRETYLADAQRLGVYLLPGCQIDSLEMRDDVAVSATGRLRRESGDAVEVQIEFRHVVVCAGAIQSPALLLRSGLAMPWLGRGLHLQPSVIVSGFWSQPVRGWEGPVQSIAGRGLSDLDGQGYGVWLETAPVHPGLAAMYLPWHGPAHHKQLLQRLAHLGTTLVLCRDTTEGQVKLSADGRPVLGYRLNSVDSNHLRTGVRVAVRAMRCAGAERLFLPTWPGPGMDAADSDESFERRLEQELGDSRRKLPWKLFSAHPLSSCRMATSPTRGVVDLDGRVFGTKNVYVTDGSVLPTAAGVNPMLTIITMSHFLAQKIKALT